MRFNNQRLTRLLAVVFTLTFVGGAIGFTPAVVTATNSQPTPDATPDWSGSQANKPVYWENWLHKEQGGKWICYKVDREGSFVTGRHWDAIITKGGQQNNVYYDVVKGTSFKDVKRPGKPPAGISHYFKCKVEKPPKPPEPELRIQITCVAHNSSGERKVVRTRVYYDTDGVQMVLKRKVVIDRVVRMRFDDRPIDVWADGLWVNSYHRVGYGRHTVTVVAKMGGLRVEKTKVVFCDKKPVVEVLGPCGDPMYGVRVINRTADGKRLVVRLDGRVVVNRWVPKYSVVVTRAFFAEGGQRLTVRLDGKLFASEITKGGTFPWNTRECKILRAQVQTA